MTPTSKAADRIVAFLEKGPADFYAILKSLDDVEYPIILCAWAEVRERDILARDHSGNYLLKGSAEGLAADH